MVSGVNFKALVQYVGKSKKIFNVF